MKDDRLFFSHLREAVGWIETYAQDGREAFLEDRKTQDAVIRNLEIIGEAVKNLSADATSGNPEIPWRQMAGLRDKLIHGYFGVNLDLVWEVVQNDLPRLRKFLDTLPTTKDR